MSNPLSRAAMKNILRERNPKMTLSRENKAINLNKNLNKKEYNLNNNEDCILKSIIKGEQEVIESRGRNAPTTLEEAANRIKNNR